MPLNRIYLENNDPRFGEQKRLIGIGIDEVMPPGYVSRGRGLKAWLAVMFHDEVEIQLNGYKQWIGANKMVIWDQNRPHFFGHSKQEWSHTWIVFSGSFFQPEYQEIKGFLEKPTEVNTFDVVMVYFQNILRELNQFDNPDTEIIACNIRLLLRESFRSRLPRGQKIDEFDPVERAVRFIEKNLSRSMDDTEIGSRAGVTTSRLQTKFSDKIGTSIQKYLESRRMKEACYWLAHTGFRVSEVAQKVGYPDPLYFTRRFTKCFGMSPTSYRNTHYSSEAPKIPDEN